MAAHATRYNELMARGGQELHHIWTDVNTSSLRLTPDFPGTRGPERSRIKGDIDGSATVSNLKDLAGNPVDMPKYQVHQTDRVVVFYTGGPAASQDKKIVAEPGPDSVVAESAFTGIKTDVDVWLYEGGEKYAWECIYLHLENGPTAAVKYEFVDEAGSPVTKLGPLYLNANDHRTIEIPWQNTVDDRLYIKADKAAVGSLTMWVVRAAV